MGNDTPLAVLSDRKPLLYSYFKQLFAQVTNPPIDSIREAIVMSVQASVGSERNLLDETPEHARQLVIDNPILRDDELEQLRQVARRSSSRARSTSPGRSPTGADGLERALERICAEADAALADGREHPHPLRPRRRARARARCRRCSPSAAVHHHLVRRGTRLQAGLVVESGEPRSVHSVAVLIGYGAAAVNPYLMLETLRRARRATAGCQRDDGRGGAAPRGQGDREGPAEDDLEDGHLDDPVVLRRADLRGGRALARARRAALHRHAVADRRHRPRDARRGALARHARAYPGAPTSCCRSSASTRGAATASTTSGTRRRSRCCSTPCGTAAGETYEEYSRRGQRGRRAPRSRCAGCCVQFREDGGDPARRRRAGRRDREALLDRRDVARLDLARGARDARHRDEPDRRPLEHRRGRRGSDRSA